MSEVILVAKVVAKNESVELVKSELLKLVAFARKDEGCKTASLFSTFLSGKNGCIKESAYIKRIYHYKNLNLFNLAVMSMSIVSKPCF